MYIVIFKDNVEQSVVATDAKHLLFPSQMQKFSNLITILAQYRDICEKFQENTGVLDQVVFQIHLNFWNMKHHYWQMPSIFGCARYSNISIFDSVFCRRGGIVTVLCLFPALTTWMSCA